MRYLILLTLSSFLLVSSGCAAADLLAQPEVLGGVVPAVLALLALVWRLWLSSRLGWATHIVSLARELAEHAVDEAIASSERGLEAARADGVVTPEEWEGIQREARRIFWANMSPKMLGQALARARAGAPGRDDAPVINHESWADRRIDRELGTRLKAKSELGDLRMPLEQQ